MFIEPVICETANSSGVLTSIIPATSLTSSFAGAQPAKPAMSETARTAVNKLLTLFIIFLY
jgi:hypothetical protein